MLHMPHGGCIIIKTMRIIMRVKLFITIFVSEKELRILYRACKKDYILIAKKHIV